MGGTRYRKWILGVVAIAAVVGIGFAIGGDRISAFVAQLKDLKGLVRGGGYTALAIIVFCETGLLIGFFLPGDSLLVTAGVLAAVDVVDIGMLNLLLIPAAILGDAVNYSIGRRTGPAIFRRDDGILFKKAHIERTQRFYARHGGKTIVMARFLPIVRTFAPFAAGMAGMPYRRFLWFNVTGAVAWVSSLTFAGYLLAKAVPDVDRKLHLVIPIVIALSFVPGVVEVLRERRRLRRERAVADSSRG